MPENLAVASSQVDPKVYPRLPEWSDGVTAMSDHRSRLLPSTGTGASGDPQVRAMLEQMGVDVIEVDAMRAAAVYVREIMTLYVRRGISSGDFGEAADQILLGDAPSPHPSPQRDSAG